MQNDTLAAVDIAKEVFEVGVSDRPGRVPLRRRLPRDGFLAFIAQFPQATVVMEACGSAHFWARRIEELGHVVVLLPPQYVRPYVVRNKTDRTDVDARLEAFGSEQIRSVPIKTVTRQVIATLHRLRSGWLADRVRRLAGDPHRGCRSAARSAGEADPHRRPPPLGTRHLESCLQPGRPGVSLERCSGHNPL